MKLKEIDAKGLKRRIIFVLTANENNMHRDYMYRKFRPECYNGSAVQYHKKLWQESKELVDFAKLEFNQ